MDVMAVVAVPETSPLFHDMALEHHAGITVRCTIPTLIQTSVEASVLILAQLVWGTGDVSHAVPSFAILEHQDPLCKEFSSHLPWKKMEHFLDQPQLANRVGNTITGIVRLIFARLQTAFTKPMFATSTPRKNWSFWLPISDVK